jgi:hypothetical protein
MPARKVTAKAKVAKPAKASAKAQRQSAASAAKPRAKAPAKPAKRAAKAAPAPPATKPRAAGKRKAAAARPSAHPTMGAVVSVKRDLAKLPAHLAKSAEAATALALASRLDEETGSPSECAKALLAAMSTLRGLAAAAEKKGALHGIKSGRAQRLAAGSPAG